ncbi:WGR domain-containing protein [uncultured Olleya sp.]|uniref:WGR domain-containing protein n=1 Tax=uncultured Olleya sp. TaxID=757243 RepID=UPI0025986712|nr:WGR domain-containing protein [uncultured Olleya sp.]
MKKHLEFNTEKSSKFWKIEVNENKHTVSYGKIGTLGQTKQKQFSDTESAIKDAEKLVQAKLKKGYLIIEQNNDPPEKWFEKLSHKIYTSYKAEILKYPLENYKYIQLNWTDTSFALGLSTNPSSGDHEYLNDEKWDNDYETSIEEVYRELENIPTEEDDYEYSVDFKREEWPKDSTDCFELEQFLINVCLGVSYIKLEKDEDIKKYLNNIEVIIIVSSDRNLGSFSYFQPNNKTKLNIVQTLIENNKTQQLVLDLWGEKAKKTGNTFLKHFKKVTKTKNKPKLSLKKAQERAKDLIVRYKHKEALEVIKPILEKALENNKKPDPILLEKCCDVMGKASPEKKETIYWFKKGLQYVPNGHCALSLMEYYELNINDDEALVDFCESHIQNINVNDNVDHTISCYRYLGRAYLSLKNNEKTISTYQKLYDYIISLEKTWRLDYPINDLEQYVKNQKWLGENLKNKKPEYNHVIEILTWFKNPDAKTD